MVIRKITRHMHVIGIAVTLTEMLMELESEEKVEKRIDAKIADCKQALSDFSQMRLLDLKCKFQAIRRTLAIVMDGEDELDVRKARLSAVLEICEEIRI